MALRSRDTLAAITMSTATKALPVAAAPSAPARFRPIGWWVPNGSAPETSPDLVREALHDVRQPVTLLHTPAGLALPQGGSSLLGEACPEPDALPIVAVLPACRPEQLGDRTFCDDHRLRFPYLAGAMANGIGSCEIVEAMGAAGMLGFFGAAGLSPERVDAAIERPQRSLEGVPFGFNLIHSPNEPRLESEVVELYLRRNVRLVEASAYLDLTLPVVKYRVFGIRPGPDGIPITPNRIIAKVSRVEVASKFMAPPPERFLRELESQRFITTEQARDRKSTRLNS